MSDVDDTRDRHHGCGLLVVDEHEEIRDLLRLSLSADGYKVAVVAGAREALTYLRSTAETCVILLGMAAPTMETTRFRAAQLRDRSLAWIPVVLMSGGVDAAQRARAFRAAGFLRTPLDLDQVRDTLRRIGCARTQAIRASNSYG